MNPLFWQTKYACLTGAGFLVYDVSESNLITEYHLKNSKPTSKENLLTGHIVDGSFFSPRFAPFGGLNNLAGTEGNHKKIFKKFIQQSYDQLNINEFFFRLPSSNIYQFNQRDQIRALLDLGGEFIYNEINYVITLQNWSPFDLSYGNQKKLKQCVHQEFKFKEISSDEVNSLYEIILENRKNIGVKAPVTKEKLQLLIASFPSDYHLFGVYSDENLISVAITVNVTNQSEYVFIWADKQEYRNFSPITFLLANLVDFFKDKKTFLDLGTVGASGQYLINLANYKQNLGAEVDIKFGLKVDISNFLSNLI